MPSLQLRNSAWFNHDTPQGLQLHGNALLGVGSSPPASLVCSKHDDMASFEAAMLVELRKEGGCQVCIKVDNKGVLSNFVPA